jgi:predicted enzyme involved in methoxymalonyl-ACP biosynthesis
MSCRVLGRGVEEFMFQKLLEAARAAGVPAVRASYIPTARNAVVQDLLPRLGFVETGDGSFVYTIHEESFRKLLQFRPSGESLR